jgi:hypothetical protein
MGHHMVVPLAQTVLIVFYEGCSIAVQGAIAKGSSDAFPGLSTGMLDDRTVSPGTTERVRVESDFVALSAWLASTRRIRLNLWLFFK